MSIQECSMNVSTIRLVVESERYRSLLLSFELAAQGPVGTRGRVEWMRGPGACPRWGACPGCSTKPPDKHQAPTLPHIRPLSLHYPPRSSTFNRDDSFGKAYRWLQAKSRSRTVSRKMCLAP